MLGGCIHALAGRDTGKGRSRPGLYQCSNGDCRFQFTVTTRTPLHATKLPLRLWLKAMWLILQSDKGLSSVRLAQALGVSQPTAWRMGHAVRLMAARQDMLEGTVEVDHFYMGGKPRKQGGEPPPGRGRKGTTKTPALAIVQRPGDETPGSTAGAAIAAVVACRYRSPNAQKFGRWHLHQTIRNCFWLIDVESEH